MSGRSLPNSGNLTIDQLASEIRTLLEPPRLLGQAVRRSALVNGGDGKWRAVANVIRFTAADNRWPTPDEGSITMGGLRLASEPLADDVFANGDVLARSLTNLVEPLAGAGMSSPSTRYHWKGGRNEWGIEPAWCFDYTVPQGWHSSPPDGPFLDAPSGLLFETIGDAISAWTGDNSLSQHNASDQVLRVVVPDRRAFFADIRAAAEGLVVDVTTLEPPERLGPLFVVLAGVDIFGRTVKGAESVEGGRALLPLSSAMSRVALYLVDANSGRYDRHVDHDYGVLEGESLFAPGRTARSARRRRLEAAIASGEDVHTEYKEWLPLKRDDPKSGELLEAVSAMANAEGGTIWVGVSDRGDVLGTDRALYKEFQKEATRRARSLEQLRDMYIEEVRDRILREVRPRIVPDCEWLDVDGRWVLAVHVAEGEGEPCFIEATGESFIRRGATNRRASPPDLAALKATRSSGVLGQIPRLASRRRGR